MVVYILLLLARPWRKYFKEGIEGWNEAFALAGYKDAVRAVLPDDDDWPTDYDAGDARFSTIAWTIDTSGVYSEGLAKIDPRSGEIVDCDIIMSHGWVRAWLGDLDVLEPGFINTTATHSLRAGDRKEVVAWCLFKMIFSRNAPPPNWYSERE